jgi:hypothetical protein
MREPIRVGYGVWTLLVINATIVPLLACSVAAARSRAWRRAMKTRAASETLRVRLLSDPCLWCWEIADPHRNDRLLYSSWTNEWSAYESREEALRAGQARLAELESAAAGRGGAGERREERRQRRGSARVSRRTGANAAVTLLLIGVLAATAAPAGATERSRPGEGGVSTVEILPGGRRITVERSIPPSIAGGQR